MALIPGYEYDIFISYVHDDNVAETDGEDGWVNQFYKYLDTKLNKHSKKIKIWWDARNLDNSEVFDNSIAEAIEKSAIMICLYSRRYTQSEYCLKELEHFYKKAASEKPGLLVGNRSRILPIMMSNIPYNKWPEKLRGTSSFKFHDAADEDAYGDPLKISTEGSFSSEMKKLRTALVRIFDDFSMENAPNEMMEKTDAQNLKTAAFTIFIGEVSDALYDRRDGIIAELESKGYNIITGDPSSADVETHHKQTRDAIENSQLAVHILNEVPGRKIKGDPNGRYIQKQVEIGLESSTPQLVWISSDLETEKISNEENKAFLKGLEERSVSSKNYEFVRANEGELAKVILDHTKQLEEALSKERSQQAATNQEIIKVLLDTHIDDFKPAFNLKKLLSKHNVELIFNPEDGDPQENIKSLFNNIKEAQKFIFLYGNENNKDWVDIRVKNTMKKLMEFDRFDQDIFIYMAPPHKNLDAIKVAQSPLVKVIDNSHNPTLDQNTLDQFLNDLSAKNI